LASICRRPPGNMGHIVPYFGVAIWPYLTDSKWRFSQREANSERVEVDPPSCEDNPPCGAVGP
jgi:hypothetical protein